MKDKEARFHHYHILIYFIIIHINITVRIKIVYKFKEKIYTMNKENIAKNYMSNYLN